MSNGPIDPGKFRDWAETISTFFGALGVTGAILTGFAWAGVPVWYLVLTFAIVLFFGSYRIWRAIP